MIPSDNDLRTWYEDHRELFDWIAAAEKIMSHGNVVIQYCGGKVIGCDICPRHRKETKGGGGK